MNLMEIGCEDGSCIELDKVHVQSDARRAVNNNNNNNSNNNNNNNNNNNSRLSQSP
jgi:hypothetical protein